MKHYFVREKCLQHVTKFKNKLQNDMAARLWSDTHIYNTLAAESLDYKKFLLTKKTITNTNPF